MSLIHIALLCLFVFLCFVLICSVLLQSGRSGGMAGLGGASSDTAFGAHTANVLQKFTMYCVIGFFALTVVLSKTQNSARNQGSVMDDFQAPVPAAEAVESNASDAEAAPAPAALPAAGESTLMPEEAPATEAP